MKVFLWIKSILKNASCKLTKDEVLIPVPLSKVPYDSSMRSKSDKYPTVPYDNITKTYFMMKRSAYPCQSPLKMHHECHNSVSIKFPLTKTIPWMKNKLPHKLVFQKVGWIIPNYRPTKWEKQDIFCIKSICSTCYSFLDHVVRSWSALLWCSTLYPSFTMA